MTAIVAVRKNGKTCIVSDSLVTYGERRKEAYGHLIAGSSKLFLWGNAVIGTSGSSTWNCVLKEFLSSYKTKRDRISTQTLLAAFSEVWRSHRDHYLVKSFCDNSSQYFSHCNIVVATPENLFKLTIEGNVISNENVVSIGGGHPFAYGAIRAVDASLEDPFEIAMKGIKAAAAWDPDTSGPFFGWNISEKGEFSEFRTERILNPGVELQSM